MSTQESLHTLAPDDIAESWEQVSGYAREPLLVLEPIEAFLDGLGIGVGAPVKASTVGDGHSNVTYVLERGSEQIVLRRPPRGPLPPSAHDVLREARMMRAVYGQVKVPKVLAVSDDESIIGAPFYLMEKIDGVVVTSAVPPALTDYDSRRRLGEELIDALVELHAVDWVAAGLEGFGKATGYLERQLRRFLGLWDFNKTRELETVDRLAEWLAKNMPEAGAATIVHGDYRLGNTMFGPRPPAQLVAILDWEMTTIGDPLADMGYLTALWVDRLDPRGPYEDVSNYSRQDGFLSRAELIARYEQRSGRSLAGLRWYQVLAAWKSIVFMEGNYKRAATGATDDPYLAQFQDGVLRLAEFAEEIAFGEGLA
jgi:aminoglycoside phosphotransferase (APT) family kinase protein